MNQSPSTIAERSYQFGKSVVLYTRFLWKTTEGRIIAQQLIRSATSVGANIAEGQDSSSKRQFLQYLQIALRSAKETQFWLRLLDETTNCEKQLLTKLRGENLQNVKIIAASVLWLKRET